MADSKPSDSISLPPRPDKLGERRESHNLADLPAEQIIARADELAATAEAMRAKDDINGADRAADAAQVLRDHVARRALAATEADNYARANAPRDIEE